jgi:hypothetical protein
VKGLLREKLRSVRDGWGEETGAPYIASRRVVSLFGRLLISCDLSLYDKIMTLFLIPFKHILRGFGLGAGASY